MPEIVSKSAYAGMHGKAPSAVSNWISRGLLSGMALTADGRINVEEANRQLADRLDVAKSMGKSAATAAPAPAMSPLQAIKVERDQLALLREREESEARRGRYVLVDAIAREHRRELRQLIETIEQRLPELVAQLGGGKGEVVIARRWWRSLRQAEALAARERAEGAPEFEIDQPAQALGLREVAHAA